MSNTKHPEVVVQLIGEDGNAMAIMSKVRRALTRAGHDGKAYLSEAMSGDYDNVLRVTQEWVTVE